VFCISSKSRVYLLKDRNPVGFPEIQSSSAGFPRWTVLIGRTDFTTITSIPNLTHSGVELVIICVLAVAPSEYLRRFRLNLLK